MAATKKKKVKKRPKMDAHLISWQEWEINYIQKKFQCKLSYVHEAKRKIGRSRKKCYNFIMAKMEADHNTDT